MDAARSRALATHQKMNNPLMVGIILNNIGAVYIKIVQWDTALDYYEQALTISKQLSDHSSMATTLNNIGSAYHHLEQWPQALDSYQQALTILDKIGDRFHFAKTLSNIGRFYHDLEQGSQALDYYQRSLTIYEEEVTDPDREGIVRFNMAMIYRTEGRLQEAIAQLTKLVELDRLAQLPDLESDMAMLAQVQAEWANN